MVTVVPVTEQAPALATPKPSASVLPLSPEALKVTARPELAVALTVKGALP